MNSFGRVIAVILVAILIFLFPLQYMAANEETNQKSYVHAETVKFADQIMLQGYITKDMYNEFLYKLDASDQLYDIEIVHGKSTESYDTGSNDNFSSEVNLVQNTSSNPKKDIQKLDYINTSNLLSEGTEKKNTDSKIGEYMPLSLNIKSKYATTESNIISNSMSLLTGHIHTDDCYVGHRHTAICNGTYRVEYKYSSYSTVNYDYEIYSVEQNKLLVRISRVAYQGSPNVFYAYSYDENTGSLDIDYNINADNRLDYGNPGTEAYLWWSILGNYFVTEYSKRTGVYNIGYPNSTSGNFTVSHDELMQGIQKYVDKGMSVQNLAHTSTSTEKAMETKFTEYVENTLILGCGLEQDVTPDCQNVVTSITATNPIQTVVQGENIITTATATYLDGNTGTVNCTSNYTGNVGTETVTLTYKGLVHNAKNNGSITCSTIVTTKSKEIPVSLTVIPSSFTVYNGSEPTYTVKVNYSDNTSRIITDGYIKTGFTLGAGTKVVTFSYTENGKTVSSSIEILVKRNIKTCINGHSYELDDYDNDNGCPICGTVLKSISAAPEYITLARGSELPIVITATYMDEHTETITEGWTTNFDNSQLGNQLVTVTYKGMTAYVSVQVIESLKCPICGLEYDPDLNGNDPGCPVCSKLVTSISASPDKQVIPLGEELQLEVEATYKDGHKEYVSEWISNFNSFKVGEQKVQVMYESVSTIITVFVESETQTTCPICGTVYNPIIYPDGCPSCSKIVVGIEARLRNGGTQVQLGSELSLAIILRYKDGHRVITYSDWSVDGYQSNLLGEQDVVVKWKEFSTMLEIEVVNTLNKITCPNGHVYYLDEDGNDPGCPYCDEPINSFNSQYYSNCVYTSEILDELFTNGIYYFKDGDYVTIRITPRSTSYLQKLQHIFTIYNKENNSYSYGGEVHG